MTLNELRKWGKQQTNDADILLMHFAKVDKTVLLTKGDLTVAQDVAEVFKNAVKLRIENMPLQYVLGVWEFMGLEFEVSPDVLIPREDTEVLVRLVLENEPSGAKGLEIGVGSGCISVSLAVFGGMDMVGVDVCHKALVVAERNARQHCNGRPTVTAPMFVLSDLFENVYKEDKFDFIVSNPPYISGEDMQILDKSVKDYEPHKALHGGDDGLDFYRKIAIGAKDYLKPNGRIYFEIGYNQAQDVKNILQNVGFFDINILKDTAGHDRVVYAQMEGDINV
ncbi:MAG: peptide chain release factor N(5)-glutamine methyltransferase [Defluviitaleaceae bacterium]|nr:peptide chain release factor N(5)-glutamine methyltransferase [Defluviitaleaceae bacterium]